MYVWDFITLVLESFSHWRVLIGVVGAVLSPFCIWGMEAHYARLFAPQPHGKASQSCRETNSDHSPQAHFDDFAIAFAIKCPQLSVYEQRWSSES